MDQPEKSGVLLVDGFIKISPEVFGNRALGVKRYSNY